MQKPRNTRERILFVAMDLFYTHGIHAVGLDQILEAAKLTKTTFYNHFRSKDELVEAAIRLRDDWESAAFIRGMHDKGGYDPKALLLACFDVLDEWFTDPRYQGCLFLMAMSEYPMSHHPIHQSGAHHYLMTQAELTKIAAAAGARDPEGLAKAWTLLLIGTVSLRMVNQDNHAARVAKAMAEQLLPMYLGEP